MLDAVAIAVRNKGMRSCFPIIRDTIRVSSEAPFFRIKDSRRSDGDKIEFRFHNLEERSFTIGHVYSKIELEEIEPGFHHIRIKALNRGFIPPNTFKFEIVDGDIIHYKNCRINKGKIYKLVLEKL